jgi:signal transduction histidine kinase/CheY-like chemotaxis protein/CHASE3 domain sensor protein
MAKKFLRNLQIGFGVSFFILLVSSVASYISISKLIESSGMVAHTRDVISATDGILVDLQDAETGQRGYYLTGKESFLEPYVNSLKSLPGSLKVAKDLTIDNPVQAKRLDTLGTLIDLRVNILKDLVQIKRNGGTISTAQLEEGKVYMDKCRNLIKDFRLTEEQQLANRLGSLNQFSGYTITLIILAALISLLITLLFYVRVRNDFNEREKLQISLKNKDIEINRRINIIQDIATQISKGKYDIRATDDENDGLGSLAASVNTMAASLENSFTILNNNEWRQTGLAILNEKLVGNKSLEKTTKETLGHLIEYGDCQTGAIYLMDNGKLRLQSSYGLEERMLRSYHPGEGMIGQVFETGKEKLFENIEDNSYLLNFSNGQIKINNILLLPIHYENKTIGVIELGSTHQLGEQKIIFFKESSKNIGVAIFAAETRKQVQKLLEETQAQSEELQAQHSELENLNTELEIQTQKLQASEEELKVQQEELMQSNQELEERSKLLEEKNHLIVERNLEIQQKAEELALSTKYKSEFLANMSHELRTPLNSILLLSRLMAENPEANLNEEQVESAKVIQSSGNGLLSLIDEILDLSKIEAGKMELDYQQVNINDLVYDLQSLFNPIIKEKDLEFKVDVDTDVITYLETDRMKVDQILKNLISNAIKFTTYGTVALKVENDSSNKDNIVFSVIDTGIGIAPEKQKLVFEAFQQADGSTKRKFGGTGLGLSISRELARLLGGKIELVSAENKGSTFSLTIPKSKTTEETTRPLAEELMDQISSDVEEATLIENLTVPYLADTIPDDISDDRNNITPEDKVILIVEDDTSFAKELLKFTRQQKYKGIVIVRGDLASEFAEKYLPLAILLDIQLPVKDGWQVMEEIKSNPKTRHIPVHIMSSLKVKKESLLKGAVDFINKPVALEQMSLMFKKIEDALNRYPKKVLIVEENPKHATALSYFLSNFNINSEIKHNVNESVTALSSSEVDCVILDMGVPDQAGYETLEAIKQNEGLENLPIIIFTGKNLSKSEELKIKQYADSIVIKTAHSYQRILDEVGLFLHLVEEKKSETIKRKSNKLGSLNEVLKDKTVLIADDDVRNIFSLTKALEKHQMKVISAIDGKEALQQLEDHPKVDIILMDMMMPEMDGYETTTRIRQHPKFKKLPIMAVTAKAMTGDREKCIVAGASDYISKPVDIDQLLSLLRVWLYES